MTVESIYDRQNARFDSARAMTEDDMRRAAPSIFAVTAHESRSDRFAPIPTIEVLRGLASEGFLPVGARQSAARDVSRQDYTKHLIRLRRIADDSRYSVGDTVCEILLKNANDGSCAYELLAGLFRIRCLNSLVAHTSTIDEVRVRHSGDAVAKVIEGTWRVLGEAQKALAAPQDWTQLRLTAQERHLFADAAHEIRFADADGVVDTPIKPAQMLRPRRREDAADDLWTTFNVVQENIMRGGLSAYRRDSDARGRPATRRVSTRAINGIDQDIRLNKALWALTEKMAALKGAAPI